MTDAGTCLLALYPPNQAQFNFDLLNWHLFIAGHEHDYDLSCVYHGRVSKASCRAGDQSLISGLRAANATAPSLAVIPSASNHSCFLLLPYFSSPLHFTSLFSISRFTGSKHSLHFISSLPLILSTDPAPSTVHDDDTVCEVACHCRTSREFARSCSKLVI